MNKHQEYLLGRAGSQSVRLTTLPPSCAECLEILGAPNSYIPMGSTRTVKGLIYLCVRNEDIMVLTSICEEENGLYERVSKGFTSINGLPITIKYVKT